MPELHPFVSGKWQANIPPHLPGPQQWFDNGFSFCYAPTKEMESILLGTFPTHDVVNHIRLNGNKEFFYGSIDNRFWPLLNLISGMPVASEHQIFQLLSKSGFGVTDIIKEIDRNGQGAADTDLTPMIFNDVMDLKNQFSGISNIYTTSGGKSRITNGTGVSAAKWLRDSLITAGYTVTGFNAFGYQKQISVFLNANLIWKFNLILLWSPSDTANISIQGVINGNNQFNAILNALPAPYNALGPPMKARLVQWSYTLDLNGFPVVPQLMATIAPHNPFLAAMFV